MAYSLWKPINVSLGSATYRDFTVSVDNVTIYSGRAYSKTSGSSSISIDIRDICANYLHAGELDFRGYDTNPNGADGAIIKTFTVRYGSTSVTRDVIMNWSYEPSESVPERQLLNAPICHRIQANQPLMMTVGSGNTSDEYKVFDSLHGTAAIVTLLNKQNKTFTFFPASSVTWLELQCRTGVKQHFDIVPSCNRFALYYVNALGGWDTLLIEGRSDIADSIDRTEYEKTDSNQGVDFRTILANRVTRGLTLNTGWLTDEEASNMHHLIESQKVVLYDLVSGSQWPVIVTNSECQFKTYKNQRGLVSYAITVEQSQTQYRR